jgi:hypothetical protein
MNKPAKHNGDKTMTNISKILAAAAFIFSAQGAEAASVFVKKPAKQIAEAILKNCPGPVSQNGQVVVCRKKATFGQDFMMAFAYTGNGGTATEQVIQLVLTPAKGGTTVSARVWLESTNAFGATHRIPISDEVVQAELNAELGGK